MEVFGIIGMSLGSTAFVFALFAMSRITELEKKIETLTPSEDDSR